MGGRGRIRGDDAGSERTDFHLHAALAGGHLEEALHPETRDGAQGGGVGGKGTRTKTENGKLPSASDTAAKTGKTRRTVERSVALAEKLDDQAEAQVDSAESGAVT